jgi:outer membrane protein
MIKKILLAIMIALPSMVFAQKFGVVNTQDLTTNLPEMKEAQTAFEASVKKYEAEGANIKAEFDKKAKEFEAMAEDTPQAIKDRRIAELQELQAKIQQFQQAAQQDLQRQQEQLMAPIQQKVISAIKSVGAEGGFTMIFESPMPLYYGTDVVDVTAQVKAKLGVK